MILFPEFAEPPDPAAVRNAVKPVIFDRRQRERVNLRCQVQILGDGGSAIHATTLNLSSRGFYCVADRSFTPGEQLQCLIGFSPFGPAAEPVLASLVCVAEVVRAEQRPDGFGIACRIERYKLMRGAAAEVQPVSL